MRVPSCQMRLNAVLVCLHSIIIHVWDWLPSNTSILQRHITSVSFLPLQTRCMGVFAKELNSILSNVTVRNDKKDTLANIQILLQQLEVPQPAANGQQVSQRRERRVFLTAIGSQSCDIAADWTVAWRKTWLSPLSISGRPDMFDGTQPNPSRGKKSEAFPAVHHFSHANHNRMLTEDSVFSLIFFLFCFFSEYFHLKTDRKIWLLR